MSLHWLHRVNHMDALQIHVICGGTATRVMSSSPTSFCRSSRTILPEKLAIYVHKLLFSLSQGSFNLRMVGWEFSQICYSLYVASHHSWSISGHFLSRERPDTRTPKYQELTASYHQWYDDQQEQESLQNLSSMKYFEQVYKPFLKIY